MLYIKQTDTILVPANRLKSLFTSQLRSKEHYYLLVYTKIETSCTGFLIKDVFSRSMPYMAPPLSGTFWPSPTVWHWAYTTWANHTLPCTVRFSSYMWRTLAHLKIHLGHVHTGQSFLDTPFSKPTYLKYYCIYLSLVLHAKAYAHRRAVLHMWDAHGWCD